MGILCSRFYFLMLFFVAFTSDSLVYGQGNEMVSPKNNPSLYNLKDTLAKPPDIDFMRQRLFGFFMNHKNEEVFDTSDYTYTDWGGIISFAPYIVQSGHLLNDRQTHCIIFISDSVTAELRVYLKQKNSWLKIYETIDSGNLPYPASLLNGHPLAFDFIDWNHDGVKDICFSNGYDMNRKSEKYEVWLTGRKGRNIYYLKDFSNIDEPKIDSTAGYIHSEYYHAGVLSYSIFKIDNYKIKCLASEFLYNEVDSTGNFTGNCDIVFEKNGKEYKHLKVKSETAYKYVNENIRETAIELWGK